MRILWIDIDSLRPDHLGCYGYHRNTSPTIDAISAGGLRFDAVYASDTPCLPSRTGWQTGRPGFQTGVVNHGGRFAEPYQTANGRQFNEAPSHRKFAQVLREAGYRTASISTFAERHAAWWFHAGFGEIHDIGKQGLERADELLPLALRFLRDHAREEDWFLHLNLWDPHTPYRTPESFGDPFTKEPAPLWPDAETIARQQDQYGPHSAGAVLHAPGESEPTARELSAIRTRDDFHTWINGYDTGIRYADYHLSQIMDALSASGVMDETTVVVTADHGESQGEFNVYGDHQTADVSTARIPWIIRGPGIPAGLATGLHYHYDLAAAVLHYIGLEIPQAWDAQGVDFRPGNHGRDYLVTSHAAWSCQRSVLFGEYLFMRTYHPGLKALPDRALFNWRQDPHQTVDIADSHETAARLGHSHLADWMEDQLGRSPENQDPMQAVIREGGPFHTRGRLEEYLAFYRSIGRSDIADRMNSDHRWRPGS